jgi:hypothetical protein
MPQLRSFLCSRASLQLRGFVALSAPARCGFEALSRFLISMAEVKELLWMRWVRGRIERVGTGVVNGWVGGRGWLVGWLVGWGWEGDAGK